MKYLSRLIDVLLYIIVIFSLTAAITSAIFNRPMLFTSVRSNSMYPLFQRSDLLLIQSLSAKENVQIGDIVVFKDKEGQLSSQGYIVHRIVEGNDETGYITKGDANDYTDQASGGTGRIQRGWIFSKVITIGKQPLKIPLIGYLPLWMEELQSTPYIMPLIAIILAAIIGVSEYLNSKKKKRTRKKRNGLELQFVYFFAGITISIIMGATMLVSSERIMVPYEVSDVAPGVLSGSNIGIIMVGEEITKPLSELNNRSFLPIVATITTKDKQLSFQNPLTKLKTGNTLEADMTLKAAKAGQYNSMIYVSMFYPFLPGKLIYYLANKSYWLALIAVSLLPGLPFMLYPIIDRKLRRKTVKEIRRFIRRIRGANPIFN
ncbi:MAG: signal peptidase [Herbinix sp.]|nr:signal peptidase [Herbinix sp.]